MIYAFTGKKNSGKNTAASMVNYIVNGYSFEDWKDFEGQQELANSSGMFKLQFEEKSFASKVKDVCSILTGIPREHWDNRELRDKELGIEGLENPNVFKITEYPSGEPEFGVAFTKIANSYTYRTLMQRVGTEAMRDCIHQDVWVNALMQDYKWDGKSLTDGWVPSYNDPDNAGCHPNAEPIYPNWVITDLRFDNEAKAVKAVGGKVFQIDRTGNIDNDTHASEQPINSNLVDYFIGNSGTLEELFDKLKLVIND